MKNTPSEAPIISVEHLSKRIGNKYILHDITFSVQEGECIVIGGANGAGKSMLMAHIAGLRYADSGEVFFRGTALSQKRNMGQIGLIFQQTDAQIIGETPYEDIALGPKNRGFSKDETEKIVLSCLEKMNLHEKAHFPSRCLSGGEKRRLAVAGVLAMESEVIIFDEPFANLDWFGIRQVLSCITLLKKDGKTLIILTHELEKVLAIADRFIVLYEGSLVFDGTAEDGLQQELECWGIRHPLRSYTSLADLTWMI